MDASNGKKKRPRPAQQERPPPPPPPPASLVRLLESDPRVLQYFKSLEENLDADVRKWKDRAGHYQQKLEELKEQMKSKPGKKNGKQPAKRKGATPAERASKKSKPKALSNKHDDGKESLVSDKAPEKKTPQSSVEEIPSEAKKIEDAILGELSSDDEDYSDFDDEIFKEQERNQDQQAEMEDAILGNLSSDNEDSDEKPQTHLDRDFIQTEWRNREIYSRLRDAYETLGLLGVSLISKQLDDQDASPAIEEGGTDSDGPISYVLVPRSDEDVISDLLHAIHLLTRLQLHVKDSTAYPPFVTDKLIPCCDDPKLDNRHPASEVMELVIKVLCIMDTDCGNMVDDEWDGIFSSEDSTEKIDLISIGMRNRSSLVKMMTNSLRGEIIDAWPLRDRSIRLETSALHFSTDNLSADTTIDNSTTFGSKSQSRLSSIAERCLLAQIVSRLYTYKNDPHSNATLLWNYILSTVPSLGIEEYPRFPPVLSLCVVEAITSRCYKDLGTGFDADASTLLSHLIHSHPGEDAKSSLVVRAVTLAIHSAALIWKIRMQSSDDRIKDVSRVELAAFERIIRSEKSWFSGIDLKVVKDCSTKAKEILKESINMITQRDVEQVQSSLATETSMSIQLSLTIVGSFAEVKENFQKVFLMLRDESLIPKVCAGLCIIHACCGSIQHMQLRQLDNFRLNQATGRDSTGIESPWFAKELMAATESLTIESSSQEYIWSGIAWIWKCLIQLSDGEATYRASRCFANSSRHWNQSDPLTSHVMQSLLQIAQIPTIRVINLHRRSDRMSAFVSQAQGERILVARAVARLDAGHDKNEDRYFWGSHAFDGKGSMFEVEARLLDQIGSQEKLVSLVESHWLPSDLKAFDQDARGDEAVVRMSTSERACALSHIASWKGVLRSLKFQEPNPDRRLRFQTKVESMMLISGFASGKPLLSSNHHMGPTPVCVILEDDAVLVDRFTERLSALLDELPRDFHFCSLGYSRPKTAPIAKFSSQLGIPSCIWYLTGYVLSLEGAQHLISSLPVRGPVDSWIGLKMTANWDNSFGRALGVGVHSRAAAQIPSRHDLARILQFRAFAALVPLCHQKVGVANLASTARRSWRQRDTDITYSGN